MEAMMTAPTYLKEKFKYQPWACWRSLAGGAKDLPELLDGLLGASLPERVGHACLEVLLEHQGIAALERLLDRHRLLQHVDAVLVLLDHALHGLEVAGDRAQPGDDVLTALLVHDRILAPGGEGVPGVRIGRWPRTSPSLRAC